MHATIRITPAIANHASNSESLVTCVHLHVNAGCDCLICQIHENNCFPVPMSKNGDNKVSWFSWTGEHSHREIVCVHPKQNEYDLFQKTSYAPITESKIGGNTNVQEVIPGPLGSYTVKYPVKDMQQQDSEPYENVIESITKALDGPVIHDNERSEVLRIVMRAGCVHNETNVHWCILGFISHLT